LCDRKTIDKFYSAALQKYTFYTNLFIQNIPNILRVGKHICNVLFRAFFFH